MSDIAAALAILEGAPKPAFNLDALLDEARDRLQISNQNAVVSADIIEAPDAATVNQLLALADQYKREADTATANREAIKDTLKELVGEHEGISVNGATVFTFKPVTSRVLDQPHIKSLFPDLPENAEFWKDQNSRRAEFK